MTSSGSLSANWGGARGTPLRLLSDRPDAASVPQQIAPTRCSAAASDDLLAMLLRRRNVERLVSNAERFVGERGRRSKREPF